MADDRDCIEISNPHRSEMEWYDAAEAAQMRAVLLALLAYPQAAHAIKRENLRRRLRGEGHRLLGSAFEQEPDLQHDDGPRSRQVMRPGDVELQLRHSIDAGDAAAGFLIEHLQLDYNWPEGFPAKTLAQATGLTPDDAENWRKRSWNTRLPVLHLAVGFCVVAQAARKRDMSWTIDNLLTEPVLLGQIFDEAMALQQAVLDRWPKLITAEKQYQIRRTWRAIES